MNGETTPGKWKDSIFATGARKNILLHVYVDLCFFAETLSRLN